MQQSSKKYKFPDSFIFVIGHIRVYFHLPYRQTEGIIKATIRKNLPDHPCYSQICRRVNKLDIINNRTSINDNNNNDVIIAADSTGIKVTNRGQWMQDKWNVKNKKGYLKMHVAVNIKPKEILALIVTYEKVHDGKVMKSRVEGVLNNNHNIRIKSFLADGAYDSNENFKYLKDEKRIQPIIKVKRNSIISSRNNPVRNKEVELQIKDYHK